MIFKNLTIIKTRNIIKVEHLGQINNKFEKIFNRNNFKLAYSTNSILNNLLKPDPSQTPNSSIGPYITKIELTK